MSLPDTMAEQIEPAHAIPQAPPSIDLYMTVIKFANWAAAVAWYLRDAWFDGRAP